MWAPSRSSGLWRPDKVWPKRKDCLPIQLATEKHRPVLASCVIFKLKHFAPRRQTPIPGSHGQPMSWPSEKFPSASIIQLCFSLSWYPLSLEFCVPFQETYRGGSTRQAAFSHTPTNVLQIRAGTEEHTFLEASDPKGHEAGDIWASPSSLETLYRGIFHTWIDRCL